MKTVPVVWVVKGAAPCPHQPQTELCSCSEAPQLPRWYLATSTAEMTKKRSPSASRSPSRTWAGLFASPMYSLYTLSTTADVTPWNSNNKNLKWWWILQGVRAGSECGICTSLAEGKHHFQRESSAVSERGSELRAALTQLCLQVISGKRGTQDLRIKHLQINSTQWCWLFSPLWKQPSEQQRNPAGFPKIHWLW